VNTPEEKSAYIISQAACAIIEAMGMMAENAHKLNVSDYVPYGEEAFIALADKYGIHHNAVIEYLRGV
jgi:hypothetical protein